MSRRNFRSTNPRSTGYRNALSRTPARFPGRWAAFATCREVAPGIDRIRVVLRELPPVVVLRRRSRW